MKLSSYKMGEICHLITDGKHGNCKDQENSGYYFISCKDIKNGQVNYEKARQITKEDFEETNRRTRFTAGDILITNSGSIGRMCLAKDLPQTKKTTFQKSVAIVKPNHEFVSSVYLYYYLLAENYRLCNLAGGAAQKNLLLSDMRNFDIDIPVSKNVQNNLSSMLRDYDNLIENNNRRIAILEDMVQSLYLEWFVKFRFPGYQDCKFKESSLGLIPDGWSLVALEDICERVTDGAHKSPKSVDDGVPMASVKDMHDFGFDLSNCRHITEKDYLELKRQDSVVIENDILVAKDGSYLKHTFVVEKTLKVALLSSIAMLRPSDKVKPHWLSYTLKSDFVKGRMKQCVSGVAIPRIILKDFRKFKIIFPPMELQEQWNDSVKEMLEHCWNLISRNNNLKKQRDLLLPKLISGNISL